MKNKIITFALAVAVTASSVLLMVSCGHTHTFSSSWSRDASGHWHQATCKHSTEKSDFAEHIGTADDCKCDVCGYETHTFNGTYHYNDDEHWQVASCGNVNHTKENAAHIDENNDCKCDVCGRGNSIAEHPDLDADCVCDDCGESTHSFGGKFYYDSTGHWHVGSCNNTEHIDQVIPHKDENNDCKCDDCEYVSHDFSSDLSYDETHHWHSAICSHSSERDGYEQHEININGKCKYCDYKDPDKNPIELPTIPV